MAGNAATILKNLLSTSSPKPTPSKALTKTILTHLKSNGLRKAISTLFASGEPVSYSLYAHLFQLCASSKAIVEARKVESNLVTFSPTPPVFLLNRAIECYGKCGNLNDARGLFDEMPERDGGSWNAMLSAYTQNGFAENTLELFSDMNNQGVLANEITYANVLRSCADELELGVLKQVHGLIVKRGFCGNVILESSLVDVYGKCMIMSDARRVFDEIESKNAVSWNVIVRRYLEVENGKAAVAMFFKMLREDIRPLNFTFANALFACSFLFSPFEGMQIHGVVIKIDFEGDDVVFGSLIDMYVKCGRLEDARRIFDQPGKKNMICCTSIVSGYAMSGRVREARELFNEMRERNVISWNAMLAGYTHSHRWKEALDFVFLMRKTTKDIDHVTLGLILNVCAGLSDVKMGKQVHGFIFRHDYSSNIFVSNALLDTYCKCGNLRSARIWFHQMIGWRDRVSWNALLTSYACCGYSEKAMTFLPVMQWETRRGKFTFETVLAACANIFSHQQGKKIHCFMIRNGYEINVVVRASLVDMYTKCRCLEYAIRVFKESSSWDVIICNSMILGFCQNERGREALEVFGLMEKEGIKPDHITFHGILRACICEGHVKLALQYFDSMSNEYHLIPQLEHYECMIKLYCRLGYMKELEDFVKRMPSDPTVPMLKKIFDKCKKNGYTKLGEWAARRLNELNPAPFQFKFRQPELAGIDNQDCTSKELSSAHAYAGWLAASI